MIRQPAWYPEELALATELWRQGLGRTRIARALQKSPDLKKYGRTYTGASVAGTLWRAGLKRGRPNDIIAGTPPRRRSGRKPPKLPPMQAVAPVAADASEDLGDLTRQQARDLPPVLIDGRPMVVETIRPLACLYPIGDPKAPDFAYCGRRTDEEETYCKHHRAIIYERPPQQKKERRPNKVRKWA